MAFLGRKPYCKERLEIIKRISLNTKLSIYSISQKKSKNFLS